MLLGLAMLLLSVLAYAGGNQPKEKPPNEVNFDMVSDTVGQLFGKANAIVSGNIDITMSPRVDKKDDYTINAMGQRVPKATAINTGGALHNDEPL